VSFKWLPKSSFDGDNPTRKATARKTVANMAKLSGNQKPTLWNIMEYPWKSLFC
jgi:hypothetical protein